MANSRQAKKRAIQADKRNAHNSSRRSEMRTRIKQVIKNAQANEPEKAANSYRQASAILDKLACKGLIHPNKAARHKSRLNKKLKQLALAKTA